MARNKNNSVQDDKGAAASEDVRNAPDNGNQEIEDSSPDSENQEQSEDSSPDGENQEQSEDSSPDGENQEQPERVSQILTATYPILYLSHQYKIGDELPANDPEMVKAWLTAKTAVWTPAKAGKEGSGK